jgi:hypothetical protein
VRNDESRGGVALGKRLEHRHGGRILAARNFGSHRRLQRRSKSSLRWAATKRSIAEIFAAGERFSGAANR